MNSPVILLTLASAMELSGGLLLEDGSRPGARTGMHWTVWESASERRQDVRHAMAAGPDFATYGIPRVRWASLPGGTVGYHRTAPGGFRMGLDLGAAVAFHTYTVPTYTVDESGELETVPLAGRIRMAPNARLVLGTAPTRERSWGILARPGVFLELGRNGLLAPVVAVEAAGIWAF